MIVKVVVTFCLCELCVRRWKVFQTNDTASVWDVAVCQTLFGRLLVNAKLQHRNKSAHCLFLCSTEQLLLAFDSRGGAPLPQWSRTTFGCLDVPLQFRTETSSSWKKLETSFSIRSREKMRQELNHRWRRHSNLLMCSSAKPRGFVMIMSGISTGYWKQRKVHNNCCVKGILRKRDVQQIGG